MNKKELWIQLNNYHFNHLVPPNLWHQIVDKFGKVDASTKAFADKIARKHNWKKQFSLRAIHEYKKFVYLGVISDFSVTPSKVIDIVWHEHLLFTKAYRDFCNEVIRYNFEHHPELIVLDEQTENFAVQYVKTLQLYRYEFGYDAPVDVWDLPKFTREQLRVVTQFYQQPKRKLEHAIIDTGYISVDEAPLNSLFDSGEFNDFGGGEFGGGGAGGDFSDGSSSDSSSCSSCSSGCSSCGGGD